MGDGCFPARQLEPMFRLTHAARWLHAEREFRDRGTHDAAQETQAADTDTPPSSRRMKTAAVDQATTKGQRQRQHPNAA